MDRKYSFWLLSAPGISSAKKRKLCQNFNSAIEVYLAGEDELKASLILTAEELNLIKKHKRDFDIDSEFDSFLNKGFSFVTMEEADYPEGLTYISDRPYGLFYIGQLPRDNRRFIAMVGARRASAYGKNMALALGKALGATGFTVVSGLARGIDSFSHQGCIEGGGKTIAVLGCGCDVVYPPENVKLYESIVENGCVMSEYPMGTAPVQYHFPERNRIISALAKKVIVVEARKKSGSLITADFAIAYGKDIYAVPGRIGDELSTGCNELIYQGAGVITSVQAFLSDLSDIADVMYSGDENLLSKNNNLAKEEALVYSCLDLYPKSIEDILEETGLDFLLLLTTLTGLCSRGLLKEVFKNYYIRTA